MKIIIIGGGLVGSLAAVFLGQKGHEVHLYEYRQDPRGTTLNEGRSINLALSMRGRTALRAVGLEKIVLQKAIPMDGRMIHKTDGTTSSITYDPVLKNCIYSVGRKHLNELLLDEAENSPNVHLHFGKKLLKVNVSSGTITLKVPDGATEEVKGDLIIGADGAHSAVRRDLMKATPVTFSQTYIDHGYLELSIPPENNHMMAPNHLHIWPRGKFMMIALPNLDGSWTVTLFMPLSSFTTLRATKDILGFFQTHFSDAVELIGADRLVRTFMANEASHLVSIKCSKYHYGSKVVIIGDAAHAMVPFFGQGMNAGFEDCTILNDLLHNHDYSVNRALELFSIKRNPDAEAICDLAMYNYIEMRDLVNRKSFIIRKTVDNMLYRIVGSKWVPLYQSVTFTNMNYNQCLKNKKRQDSVIRKASLFALAAGTVSVAVFLLPKIMTGHSPLPNDFCSAHG
ncbi:Kynurenine 3-monooxygenase [Nesidiocoris tenuis]|uniref:Kynurenine 3-monooxygenase n=1 Tax=Nesidiocoris tenuis TaxID=355587 RepID=A0ABN7A8K5_9HEMI|nr:Kynurenine 3-monooxygenase [Nesidiocoris tenuis]